MTVDLSAQLERYTAAVIADQHRISVGEVRELMPAIRELPTPASRDRRSVRRGLVAAAAAAVVILLLVGGVALLARPDGTAEPAAPTSTLAPPVTTIPPQIPVPPPESLSRPQMEHQVEFLSAFQQRGFLRGGGCTGQDCGVQIDSPTLGGPVTRTFTASAPDDMQWGTRYGASVREVAEEGLSALYVWALDTYPDETVARCKVGFEGDATAVAWSPGYAANSTCGEHLAGLVTEFNPSEAPDPPEEPDPTAGLWSRIEPLTPEGAPRLNVLFDVADTPVGLLATSLDGLWISQDAVEWRPYARDSVDFDGDGGFSKIAVSDLGLIVTDPSAGGPGGGGRRVWFSPDGETWVSIEDLLPIPGVSGNAATASSERFLLIDEQHHLMSSSDGTDWQEVQGLPPSAKFHLVEATPFGFYAASNRDDSVWNSRNGVEWTRLPDEAFGGAVLNDVAGSPSDLVAVTWDGRIWHSADGAVWAHVHTLPPGLTGRHLCARVGASDLGFLVVTNLEDTAGSFVDDPGIPAAWFSDNGRVWARVPSAGTPEPGLMCPNEVIPYEGGFLSVTDNQGGGGGPNDMVWVYER